MFTFVTPDNPPSVEALYVLAHRKLSQEQPEDAATLLRLMLHLTPTDERAWLGLGLCHEQVGQFDIARELYAAGTVAANPAARCALACARLLVNENRTELALHFFEDAARLAERNHDYNLAETATREMGALS
jgi:tetratricopeptide (TPR) repeat protein